MKKSIYVLIMALMVGIGAKAASYGNGDLRSIINSATDGEVIILTGDTYTYASSSVLSVAKGFTVKADPSLTVRPTVTFSGTASQFFKFTATSLKSVTFDGIDFNGGGIATGFFNTNVTSTGDIDLTVNNCVIRNLTTTSTVFGTVAATNSNGIYSSVKVTNSRILGYGMLLTSTAKTTSFAINTLTNVYLSNYAYVTANMITINGGSSSTLAINNVTFNNCSGGSRRIFNLTSGMTTTINNSVFQSCSQSSNNNTIPTAATGSGNINLSSTAFAMSGIPGTIATSPVLTNAALPAVTSLSSTDSWYYAASGTAGYYNAATITKSTSTLSGFTYEVGSGPSAAKTFTLSGADLFNKITVTAPSNYEVCKTVGGTYTSSISFLPTLGVTADSTVYVRLVAGLSAASYTGDITISSANLSNQTIALSGTVSAGGSPAFTASTGSLTGFNYIYAQGPSAEQSFTVSGSNLTANVEIAAPTNYEVSLTSGSGFGASASIPFGSGTLSAVPVYVRLKAGLNSGSYNTENIALTSTGATSQNVSCSGTVTAPTVTITPTSLTSFFALAGSATPSTEKTFTISGSNLAGNITVTPPTNYEISTTTGGAFAATNPITLSPSSGSVASTTIYVRLKGSLATASYSENITVATVGNSDATVACSGVVGTPVVKVGTSAGLDNKFSLAAQTTTYAVPSGSISGMYVSGEYLQGDVTVTAPTGFEVSKDDITFSNSVTFTVSNQTVSGQVWNRLKAGLNTDSYSGNIVFSSLSAANRNVLASGTVTGGAQLTLGVLQNPASNLNYSYNGQSLERTFTITSTNLSADVTVTPPTNFEISTTSGSGFTSSPIVIAKTTAEAGAQTIYVRTKGGLTIGTYSESIVVSTTGANNKSVAVSGTVSVATPTVTVTPIETYTYNGSPQGPIAATTTGTGTSYTFSYAGTGTTTYGPSATLPTAAGTYTATVTVAAHGNYAQGVSSATAFSILSTGAVTAANTTVSSLTLTPSSVLTVSSGGSLVIDANTTVASVTVAQGGSLTVNNGVTLGGTVTLQSTTNGTATLVDKHATPTQAAVVEQYVEAGRNWYVSAPISAAGYASLNKGNSVVEFNEITKVWDPVTSGTLVPGKGYIQVATAVQGTTGTLSFNGTANSGDITVTLSRTGTSAQSGFNLVGNPYPSYLSWSKITKVNTNVLSTAWFRTKTAGGAYVFATVNAADTNSVIIVSNSANTMITKYIPPMQAYWVRLNSGASTTDYTVTNAMRAHADNGSNKMKAPKLNTQQLVRLQVSNAVTTDEAVVYFNANAADGYDNYDSPKMSNNSASIPEIFTLAGSEKLVINGMSDVKYNTEIPLGFSTGTAGDFSISANEFSNFEVGTRLILLDKNYPTIETELTPETAYHFSAPVTTAYNNRFSLLFRAPGTTTGIKNTEKLNVQVFVNAANQITIIAPEKSNYTIYNAVGQIIENGTTNAKHETRNLKLNAGMYVVRVGNQSNRVIVK